MAVNELGSIVELYPTDQANFPINRQLLKLHTDPQISHEQFSCSNIPIDSSTCCNSLEGLALKITQKQLQ
jgi:hypothetical protein